MTEDERILVEVLGQSKGQILDRVCASCFLFDSRVTDSLPTAYWLSFNQGGSIHLFGGGDGQILRSDLEFPFPLDMQESGEVVLCDLSFREPWSRVVRKRLVSFSLIRADGVNAAVGLRMTFEDGERIVTVHDGDELIVASDYPDDPGPYVWREAEMEDA